MFFTCDYCGKRFTHQKNHEKHFCENKKKSLLLKTKLGRVAYHEYQKWRELCGYKNYDEQSFLNSKYFKPFLNFIEFSKEKSIPDRIGYMKYMQEKKIAPSYWTNETYYNSYLAMFDKIYSPIKQVEMSYNYLESLSRILECDLDAVVNNIEVIDLIKMIACRKLSPWFLLFHGTFRDLIRFRLDDEKRILLETVINVDVWREKFKNNPKSVKKVKELINYLKL